jgi:hypothetical protein
MQSREIMTDPCGDSFAIEHEGNEADVFVERYNLLSVDCSDELQLLRVGGADGNNHSSRFAELGEKRRRKFGSRGGDENGVEWSVSGKSKSTISGKH